MSGLDAFMFCIVGVFAVLGVPAVYFHFNDEIDNLRIGNYGLVEQVWRLSEELKKLREMVAGSSDAGFISGGGCTVLPVEERAGKANRSRNRKRRNTAKRSRKASKGKSR